MKWFMHDVHSSNIHLQVRQIKEGIEAVPDGVHTQRKPFKVTVDLFT